MKTYKAGPLTVTVEAHSIDPTRTVEYGLDRDATALKKAGDMDGAIAALRSRKATMGALWCDDKLAKYLQHAGRFAEAQAEIQWLIDHAEDYVAEMYGHQPATGRQAALQSRLGRVHRAAALICKREGQADAAARHSARADRHMASAKRLQEAARAAARRKREALQARIAARRGTMGS